MNENTRILKSIGCKNIVESAEKLTLKGPGIFYPTATTAYLLRASLKLTANAEKILDLGCGSGVIGLELAANQQLKRKVYMSDLSREACVASVLNAEILELNNVSVRNGSMFEPWSDEKFDVVVSDVSGVSVSAPVSKIWFDGIPQDSGENGLKLTSLVLLNAQKYLRTEKSFVLLPLISLADQIKFWDLLKTENWHAEVVSEHVWKLPIKNKEEKSEMLKQKKEGNVQFDLEEGNYVCFTKILKIEPLIWKG